MVCAAKESCDSQRILDIPNLDIFEYGHNQDIEV